MKIQNKKLFVIKKYVMAKNAREAIRLEKKIVPDDVWIDEAWKSGGQNQLASAIGFAHYIEEDYE